MKDIEFYADQYEDARDLAAAEMDWPEPDHNEPDPFNPNGDWHEEPEYPW